MDTKMPNEMEKITQPSSKRTMWIIVGVLVLIALYFMSSYNGFVSLNERVNNSWAQIDTQLQRRYDLIPNLVETVKGIAGQEKDVFGALALARTKYAGATTPDARAQAANQVESSLSRLLVIVENYPQLRSTEAFTSLMVQLEGTENRIAVARKDYNDSVTLLDTRIKAFPANLIAKAFGFSVRTYFEIPDASKANPQVKFGN
jgi:LemA protein